MVVEGSQLICSKCVTRLAAPGQRWCRECKALWNKTVSPEQLEVKYAHTKEWHSAHPEYDRRRHQDDPERTRVANLKNLYKITPERKAEMLAEQGGRCAVCGTTEPKLRWDVDHDHACCPGQITCGRCIRGILCDTCNRGLGLFHDRPAVLRSAATYLENPPQQEGEPRG